MREIIAMEEFGTPYLTQREEIEDEARIYVTRISGVNIKAEEWRGATEEEKNNWENYEKDY